jgi:hypothetical protein
VQLKETLQLLEQFKGGISDLFKQTLISTYFLFHWKYYHQKYGIAVVMPLAPTVANYFTEHSEKQALDTAPKRPTCRYRYVDDTFAIWPHGIWELREFQNQLDIIHANIKFTKETERKIAHYHFW